MAEVNFSTRMLLPAALLILLSGTIVAEATEKVKRCYWCGPLAEQVHRSRRAPPCGPTLQETTCDEGYTHCAAVATSPPYVESRLCVKFYQDECYSLYCNSSKTWRMICPCQGNLCNGLNTDRETTAFATLAKIVGKNKRSKRSLTAPKGFIPITPRKKVEIENTTINIVVFSISDNETTYSVRSDLVENEMVLTTAINHAIEEQGSENGDENVEENTIEKDDSEMQGDEPIKEQMETNDAVTEDDENHVEDTTKPEHGETIADVQTHVIPTIVPEVNNDNDKPTVTIPVEYAKEHEVPTEIPTLTSILPTSIQIELSVVQIKNPKDNLPLPEALQQNVTPAKVSAPTTMANVEVSTNENIETTTHSIKETVKNTIEKAKTNEDKHEADKNGEDQSLATIWELVLLMNIIIYFVL